MCDWKRTKCSVCNRLIGDKCVRPCEGQQHQIYRDGSTVVIEEELCERCSLVTPDPSSESSSSEEGTEALI